MSESTIYTYIVHVHTNTKRVHGKISPRAVLKRKQSPSLQNKSHTLHATSRGKVRVYMVNILHTHTHIHTHTHKGVRVNITRGHKSCDTHSQQLCMYSTSTPC